jgi:lipopolysaccharide assembly protein B
MDFDFQWLLLALPVAFALGWAASRLDLRQVRREAQDSPRAYFKGLNLLLNEQHDKAIDAFIEAVQHDPDTAELHFALGNLFRRRGEFERAVRVHEHLLSRADLKAADRDRAQHALAQDFMKAGLLDRAEAAWRALEGTAFDGPSRLAQLTLAERSRDWARAVELAHSLQASQPGQFAARLSHYECERALQAEAQGQPGEAQAALGRARVAAPAAPRPLLQAGQGHWKAGRAEQALSAWGPLLAQRSPSFLLIASDYARAVLALGPAVPTDPAGQSNQTNITNQANQTVQAATALQAWLEQLPAIELLDALALLRGGEHEEAQRWTEQLSRHPSLSAAQRLLRLPPEQWGEAGLLGLRSAIDHVARPLQRYRCAACGFEAQHYFWQCPGCLNWESYPPQRLDAQ